MNQQALIPTWGYPSPKPPPWLLPQHLSTKCYPCARSKVLPICSVAHGQGEGGWGVKVDPKRSAPEALNVRQR